MATLVGLTGDELPASPPIGAAPPTGLLAELAGPPIGLPPLSTCVPGSIGSVGLIMPIKVLTGADGFWYSFEFG